MSFVAVDRVRHCVDLPWGGRGGASPDPGGVKPRGNEVPGRWAFAGMIDQSRHPINLTNRLALPQKRAPCAFPSSAALRRIKDGVKS
jgi:hypothetical protein